MKTLIIDIIFTMLMLICLLMSAIEEEWLLFSLAFTVFIIYIFDMILDYKKWKEKNKNDSNHTL